MIAVGKVARSQNINVDKEGSFKNTSVLLSTRVNVALEMGTKCPKPH